MPSLYMSVIWIGTVVIFVSFIIALAIKGRKNVPVFMKYFYFYPLLALCVSFNTILGDYFHFFTRESLLRIQNILFIIDFLFWYFFFKNLLKKKIRILQFIFLLFLTSTIILRLSTGFHKPGFEINAVTNFGKILFCLFYCIELFKSEPVLNLKNESAFWIVSGLFFYTCVSLPFYTVYEYLNLNLPRLISRNLFSSTNISIILMHLLFIKAYLCQIHRLKVS